MTIKEQLEDELIDLEAELEDMEDSLSSYESEIEYLESLKDSLESDIHKKESQIKDIKKRIELIINDEDYEEPITIIDGQLSLNI